MLLGTTVKAGEKFVTVRASEQTGGRQRAQVPCYSKWIAALCISITKPTANLGEPSFS